MVVREGDALVFDLPTQKLVRHFEFDPGGYRLATISADGRWLATTSDYGKLSNITLFPLDHPNPPAVAVELPIRTSTYTTGLAFTPDGKRLLTSHAGGIAHVWDITRFTSDTGSPREDELWVALGADDGEAVGKCMAELVQTPRVAVAMIGRRLLPVERVDEKAVKTRIAELGSADFRTREAATKAIESLDERVVPLV